MAKVMVQFQYKGPAPAIEDVARKFNIDASLFDPEFGVIATDPQAGLYTVLVDDDIAAQMNKMLQQDASDEASGAFSNPRIEPFGPPED